MKYLRRRVAALSRAHPLPAAAMAAALILVPLARSVRSAPGGTAGGPAETMALNGPAVLAPSDEARILPGITGTEGALSLPEGGWIVLDPPSGRLHRLGAGMERLWSTAGTGDGPGELRRPVGVAPWDDGFAVVDGQVRRLDLFDARGRHRERRPLAVPDCGVAFATTILPSPDGGVALLIRCARPGGSGGSGGSGGFAWYVGEVTPDSPVRAGRSVVDVSPLPGDLPERSGAGEATAAWQDRILLRWDHAWWVGVVGGPCLVPLKGEGRLCHPDDAPVALPDSLRRRLSRLPGSPAPVRYPPFVGASPSPRGPLLHVPVEPAGEGGEGGGAGGGGEPEVAYDLLRSDGTLFRLRSSAFRIFFGDGTILLAEPRLDGTELQSVPWPPGTREFRE